MTTKQPDIGFVGSAMGGGWAIPLTPRGTEIAAEMIGEEAYPIAPLNGQRGYIVEPNEAGLWLDMACQYGLVLRLPDGAIVCRPKAN